MSAAARSVSEPAGADEIVRYGFNERLCHWMSAFSYTYCCATGLAFFTPHLFWLALALGGGATSRFWHPVFGLVFFLVALWMHALWHDDMSLTAQDRLWLREVKYYAANEDSKMPLQGRFNAGQKVYYWAMYYSTMALLASGVFMWFPEYVPAGLHWVRGLSILVHECAALVTIGMFITHVYMSVFLEEGSFQSMLTGGVSRAWAWTHHRLWYREVVGQSQPKR